MSRFRSWTLNHILRSVLTVLLFTTVPARSGESSQLIDAKQRSQILETMADELEAGYLFADQGEVIAAGLRSASASDRFGEAESTQNFITAVNEYLLELSDDLHLRMGFQSAGQESESVNIRKGPRPVPKGSSNTGPVSHGDHTHGSPAPPQSAPGKRSRVRQLPQGDGDEQHGFASWSVLDGNIGYIDLRVFGGPEAKVQADEAMMAVADADALILDLRQNGGGGPFMVRYISGFLFEEPTHLTDTFMRGWDAPEERWTLIEGRPTDAFVDKPVFVLISNQTFSAAESFTFGLVINDRITTVGQRTGGGGHFGQMVELGDGYRFFLPRGRTYDPETGLGWEAEGIQPNIETPVDDALDVALDMALREAQARINSR